MSYNWQQSDWPHFRYDASLLEKKLYQYEHKMGLLQGAMLHLSSQHQTDIALQLMVNEAIKTAEIEGEMISRLDVMSSIKRHLGLQTPKDIGKDARALGVAALMNHARDSFMQPFSEHSLCCWHDLLLGYAKGLTPIEIGKWRTHQEPMQIISGPYGKPKIHFEAPPSHTLQKEMRVFITWFNETRPGEKNALHSAPIRSGLAHLYFESIHPFEDGNGRIGRALSEKALSQALGAPIPYSISSTIQPQCKAYYAALKEGQSSNEVTSWLLYFVEMLIQAQDQAEALIQFTLKKTIFLDENRSTMNERQRKVVLRMLDFGPEGFEGGMTAKKYMAITHCSKATATRDLTELLNQKIFNQGDAQGRNVYYQLLIEKDPGYKIF